MSDDTNRDHLGNRSRSSGPAVGGLLIDIDGVLTVSWSPIVGAREAMATLRRSRLPLHFATNTTSMTQAEVAGRLTELGIPVREEEVLTAPAATADHLRRHHPGARCFVLNEGDLSADLAGVDVVHDPPADVVVIGGAGPSFTHDRLNTVFRLLLDGADFVAMHRNLSWRTRAGFELDAGAYVEALRAAADSEPTIVGKPSSAFFEAGVAALGVEAGEVLMVGDDIDNDVLAAQELGLRGVLVRTGKFRQETLDRADRRPDAVIDSFADLPMLLGLD